MGVFLILFANLMQLTIAASADFIFIRNNKDHHFTG
jgi:hypothetical protein